MHHKWLAWMPAAAVASDNRELLLDVGRQHPFLSVSGL